MHIAIDCRFIHASGIGRYVREIVNLLIRDNSHKFTLIIYKKDRGAWGADKRNNVDYVKAEGIMYSVREQWEIPFKIPSCDIFWSPHYNVPILPIAAKKRVVTIHDVNHLAFSSLLTASQKIYATSLMYVATRSSDLIITDSEFSKNEIVKYTGVSSMKIKTIYCGFDNDNFKPANLSIQERIAIQYNLPENFILHVGNVKPHKNISRLIQAFSKVQTSLPDVHLVILGKKDNFITGILNLQALIQGLGVESKVHFTGFVDEEDLPTIYNMADVLVFPSLYEGFGFPPLEAMACGCPAVVSNVASLPEICGDAAHYIDPYNVDNIAEGIYEVLSNNNLRECLVAKGYERVKEFCWEDAAKDVLRAFEIIHKHTL